MWVTTDSVLRSSSIDSMARSSQRGTRGRVDPWVWCWGPRRSRPGAERGEKCQRAPQVRRIESRVGQMAPGGPWGGPPSAILRRDDADPPTPRRRSPGRPRAPVGRAATACLLCGPLAPPSRSPRPPGPRRSGWAPPATTPPSASGGAVPPPGYAGFDVAVARAWAEERGHTLQCSSPSAGRSLLRGASRRREVRRRHVRRSRSGPSAPRLGRFTQPVAEGGAVVLVGDTDRFRGPRRSIDTRRNVRIGVNRRRPPRAGRATRTSRAGDGGGHPGQRRGDRDTMLEGAVARGGDRHLRGPPLAGPRRRATSDATGPVHPRPQGPAGARRPRRAGRRSRRLAARARGRRQPGAPARGPAGPGPPPRPPRRRCARCSRPPTSGSR